MLQVHLCHASCSWAHLFYFSCPNRKSTTDMQWGSRPFLFLSVASSTIDTQLGIQPHFSKLQFSSSPSTRNWIRPILSSQLQFHPRHVTGGPTLFCHIWKSTHDMQLVHIFFFSSCKSTHDMQLGQTHFCPSSKSIFDSWQGVSKFIVQYESPSSTRNCVSTHFLLVARNNVFSVPYYLHVACIHDEWHCLHVM